MSPDVVVKVWTKLLLQRDPKQQWLQQGAAWLFFFFFSYNSLKEASGGSEMRRWLSSMTSPIPQEGGHCPHAQRWLPPLHLQVGPTKGKERKWKANAFF